MNKLPCINCICLAICKSKYNQILNSDLCAMPKRMMTKISDDGSVVQIQSSKDYKINCMGYARFRVAERCNLLASYLYDNGKYNVITIPIPYFQKLLAFRNPYLQMRKLYRFYKFDSYYIRSYR